MQIRDTDITNGVDQEALVQNIKEQRSRQPMWLQILGALSIAIISSIGGYQVVQVTNNEEKDAAHQSLSSKLEKLSQFSDIRWVAIAENSEKQYDTIAELHKTVQIMVSQCAAVKERDDSMQRQIEKLERTTFENNRLIIDHLKATKSHSGN